MSEAVGGRPIKPAIHLPCASCAATGEHEAGIPVGGMRRYLTGLQMEPDMKDDGKNELLENPVLNCDQDDDEIPTRRAAAEDLLISILHDILEEENAHEKT